MKEAKGFTLLELLVVVAIIGLLATIAVVSLQQARAKARDAKRLANADQIVKALELYYDENEEYPFPMNNGLGLSGFANSQSVGDRWDAPCGNFAPNSWESFGCFLSPYIDIPIDPINNSAYNIWVASNPSFYYMAIFLEADHPKRCDNQNSPYQWWKQAPAKYFCGPGAGYDWPNSVIYTNANLF